MGIHTKNYTLSNFFNVGKPQHPAIAFKIGLILYGSLAVLYLRRSVIFSAIGIFQIVRKHGSMIGMPDLDPHDLRRTYAQLGYEAGIPLTQLSKLLGHSNIATTQKYLNLELNLDVTASDFTPLE